MGEKTGIEWTEKTWNPWMGCTKVSPGCKHCYMFREQKRYGNDPTVVRRSKTTFRAPLKWAEPSLIFTCSWSDFFHEDADAWRDEAWEVIEETPHHTYQILTKRPERLRKVLPAKWFGSGYKNVWLGVSVESQEFMSRWRELSLFVGTCPVLWISAEPLLGPIRLHKPRDLDWLVVGGESGSSSRRVREEWVLDLRRQCEVYDVPFFFKQWGGFGDKRGGDKALLEGKRYTEMPEANHE